METSAQQFSRNPLDSTHKSLNRKAQILRSLFLRFLTKHKGEVQDQKEPPKTKMTIQKRPFEDVISPIKKGDQVGTRGLSAIANAFFH